jgi:hypothetical protein
MGKTVRGLRQPTRGEPMKKKDAHALTYSGNALNYLIEGATLYNVNDSSGMTTTLPLSGV